MKRGGRDCSRRERLELTATALVPAALGLLGPVIARGGRLCWLAPALALPLGTALCQVWGRLGEQDLQRGLERGLGSWGGKAAALAYLIWGLVLLADSARRYSDRLLTLFEGERVRWLFLLGALGVTLWLGRKGAGAFARAGRIFFLAVWIALWGILLLTLPGVDWKNLLPPEPGEWRGLAGAGALCLSLAGYGVYALCLPRRRGEAGERTWPWAAWGCGALGAVLFVVVGAFGPALAERMEDPFLYLLEGVQVPGAFQRGEAGLAAVLSLADLVLLALLGRGCMALWGDLLPSLPALSWVPVAGAFLLAGVLPTTGELWRSWEEILPAGNLILGVGLPTLAVLLGRARGRTATFCGTDTGISTDVAVKKEDKKSQKENEKKC